jgi:AraC family transcriptional regulator
MQNIPWDLNLNHAPEIIGIGTNVLEMQKPSFSMSKFCALHFFLHSGEMVFNGTRYPLKEGTLAFTPANGIVHYEKHPSNSRHIWVHMKILSMNSASPGVYYPSGSEVNRLFLEFQEAMGYASINSLLLQVRVWDILLRYNKVSLSSGIKDILCYIENNLHEDIPIAVLSKKINLSADHLTRLIKKETGKTLVAYIRYRRISRAAVLLKSSDLPIKQIAYQVAIPNAQAFNKSFKKEFVLSPNIFREKWKTL